MHAQGKNQWNKTLRFSWGHILAFLALIFIGYVVFMGIVYSRGGVTMAGIIGVEVNEYILAGVFAVIDVSVLFVLFMGVQWCKAAEKKFARNIIWERILLCLCVLVFFPTCLFGSYNHFFGVWKHHEKIEKEFSQAIAESEQLFTEYEKYANERINRFQGAISRLDEATRDAYLKTLKLQLLSKNEGKLRSDAVSWINGNRNASVWNIYLMGNVDDVMDRIDQWNKALVKWSTPVLTHEGGVYSFASKANYVLSIKGKLDDVAKSCKEKQGLRFGTVWTSILLFLMLLLPYLLQDRNTKAQGFYSLLPKRESKSHDIGDDTSKDSNDSNVGASIKSDGSNGWNDVSAKTSGADKTPAKNDDIYSGTI